MVNKDCFIHAYLAFQFARKECIKNGDTRVLKHAEDYISQLEDLSLYAFGERVIYIEETNSCEFVRV